LDQEGGLKHGMGAKRLPTKTGKKFKLEENQSGGKEPD